MVDELIFPDAINWEILNDLYINTLPSTPPQQEEEEKEEEKKKEKEEIYPQRILKY